MSISKRSLMAASAAVLIGLSSAAIAQTKKSSQVTTVGDGEAIMIGPKGAAPAQIQRQDHRRSA